MKRIAASSLVAGAVVLLFSLPASAGEDHAGKGVFMEAKCQACHSVKSADIKVEGEDTAAKPEPGEVAPPDLSNVGSEAKADFLKAYLTKKEKLNGKKHIKKFAGTEAELASLTEWLLTLKAAPAK